MSDKARLEVVKAGKPMQQNGIPLPGADQTVVYEGAKRRLSVVETCNGGPGTITALRVEVGTSEQYVTANRPNYRIAVDIPLNEALVGILSLALDRAEENSYERPTGFLHSVLDEAQEELVEIDAADILLEVDGAPITKREAREFRKVVPGGIFIMRDEEEAFLRFRENFFEADWAGRRDANDHSDLVDPEDLADAEARRQEAGVEITPSDIMQDFDGNFPTERVPETDKEVVTPRSILKEDDED